MKQCAFLTLQETGDFVIDDVHAIEPLRDLGWNVSVLPWQQTARDWSEFAAVIIRSTWDYFTDVDAFMGVLQRIDEQSTLANPLELVRWNLAKTYLRDLEQQGIGIVPTLWTDELQPDSLPACFDQLDVDELVIKPVIGANGEDTFRLQRHEAAAQAAPLVPLFRQRPLMVQRFMPSILDEGEYSLFFFSGRFSHAILKVPAGDEFRSQEERGAAISPVQPEARLLQRATEALACVQPTPLYARIDLVRDAAGDFVLMELELIEPSLYLRTDPAAPAHFARAVDDWLQR